MAESNAETTSTPLHLAVVGGGVAGCAAAAWAAGRGVEVTVFNAGLPLGGTCIHTGTFPARMLMAAATDYHRARHPRFPGLDTEAHPVDWAEIEERRQQMAERIRDRLRAELKLNENVQLVDQRASFQEDNVLRAGDKTYRPDRVLLTPGTHSRWPDIEGLDAIDPLTIAELSTLKTLPNRLLFVDVNDTALAYAQLLSRMGTEVVILHSRQRLFGRDHAAGIDEAVVELLGADGVDVVSQVSIADVEQVDGGVEVGGEVDGKRVCWQSDEVVVANHRQPHIDGLYPERAGIELTDEGFIVIDESMQTTNPDVFAAGDAIGRGQHANAAAYDAILAARNAVSPSKTAGHNTAVPFAVYTDPQLAGVGWGEPMSRQAGFVTDTAVSRLENLPAGQAQGLERGFVKLIRDQRSDHLLGARILAPHASALVMELALAVRYGLTVSELATLVHPPISMSEAIGRAARKFGKRRPRPSGDQSLQPGGP